MNGKLYGIGTGPGDPELLTIKAVKKLCECDVIAAPRSGGDTKAALDTVKEYIKGKPIFECRFSMDKDRKKREACRTAAADGICGLLSEGKNVGYVTLGEPTVYSTYMYLHKLVAQRGFDTEIISGIPSFVAAAAALNESLCEGDEPLLIIPASNSFDSELLNFPGNKVIMKAGAGLNNVAGILREAGLSDCSKIVERCTMDGERIWHGLNGFGEGADAGYFSVVIVNQRFSKDSKGGENTNRDLPEKGGD